MGKCRWLMWMDVFFFSFRMGEIITERCCSYSFFLFLFSKRPKYNFLTFFYFVRNCFIILQIDHLFIKTISFFCQIFCLISRFWKDQKCLDILFLVTTLLLFSVQIVSFVGLSQSQHTHLLSTLKISFFEFKFKCSSRLASFLCQRWNTELRILVQIWVTVQAEKL